MIRAFARNYGQLVDKVIAAGAYPVLMTNIPVSKRHAATFDMAAELKMNSAIKSIAKAKDALLIDTYAAFAGPDGFLRPGWSDDGMHPNNGRYIPWLQKAAHDGLAHIGRCS